jgi:hypothetical protein
MRGDIPFQRRLIQVLRRLGLRIVVTRFTRDPQDPHILPSLY